jgi:cytidylate kinase
MPVITVSRQYASGGSNIARLVAERLGWALVDNEFVDRVARQAGISRQEVEEREERVPGLAERLARALAISSPEVFVATGEPPEPQFGSEADLVRATEAVINQAVRQEERLIMVGRGAQAHLAQHEDSLHVYVVAPRERRIRAAADRLDVSAEEAESCVDKTDEGRRRYVKANYQRQWEDATNYHLVLNTAAFSYEQCADLIVEAARTRGWA